MKAPQRPYLNVFSDFFPRFFCFGGVFCFALFWGLLVWFGFLVGGQWLVLCLACFGFFNFQSVLSKKLAVVKCCVLKKITWQYFALKKTDLMPGCGDTFPNITFLFPR